jgi:preprotein translocase subunit SecF
MINWMKFRFVYFLFSGLVIGIGIFSLFKWGLKLGVDFTGGTIIEYQTQKTLPEEELKVNLEKEKITVSSIQKTGENTYLFRTAPLEAAQKPVFQQAVEKLSGGKVNELRFETVGPSIGPELIQKTVYALLMAAGAILLWVAYQFKSIKFGASAVLAMFHDSLVLLGLFSLFGHLWGAEIDFLFVTAMLTILSFSVHDTIVVYDRIRESHRKIGGEIKDLANKALTETMVRSFNNSMTIVFMLIALVLLGGVTTKWFAVALLVGTVSGTYSSPFVAVPILVTWDEIAKKLKRS